MTYIRSKYRADNSTAIMAYSENRMPYAHVTICLVDWGLTPNAEDIVFIPLSALNDEDVEMFKRDLVAEELDELTLGVERFLMVRLREDWKRICRKQL